jgi:hypothetical protein
MTDSERQIPYALSHMHKLYVKKKLDMKRNGQYWGRPLGSDRRKEGNGGRDINEVCVSRFEKDVVRPIPKNYEKGQGKMAV